MKKKRIFKVLLLAALCVALCTGIFAACDGDTEKPLDKATDVTYDFNSGTYSFTGVSDASFYYVKIYASGKKNNVMAESAKINATESNKYTGTITDIIAPGNYDVYVVASALGYTSSESDKITGESVKLINPTLAANWSSSGEVTINITVTAGDSVSTAYSVTVKDKDGVAVYINDNLTTASLILHAEDVGAVSLAKTDTYSVSVKANAFGKYTASGETSANVTEARWRPF